MSQLRRTGPRRRAWLIALCVAALPGHAPREPARELVDAAARCVDWSLEHGFVHEGAALARRCLRAAPGHRVAGALRRAAELDAHTESAALHAERRRHDAEWTQQVTELRGMLADAVRGASPDAAREVVRVAGCLDPELPGIGSRLADHGFGLLGRHGPVPARELAAATRGLQALGGGVSATVAGERRATWPDAYTVRTAHFRITTDVPLPLAASLAADLERVHGSWESLAVEARLAVVAAPGECSVLAFGARPTFDMLGVDGLLKQACAREPGTVGVYSLFAREAAAFLPGDDEVGRRQLRENLCHEVVHQLFHLRVAGRRNIPPPDIPFSWIEEAVCMHYETTIESDGGGCDDDLREGLFRARVDDDPWTRVERVAGGVFLDAGDYGCAALVARWLLSGQAGVRASFLAALRADLEGLAPDRGAVLRSLGERSVARAEFRAFCDALDAECGRR